MSSTSSDGRLPIERRDEERTGRSSQRLAQTTSASSEQAYSQREAAPPAARKAPFAADNSSQRWADSHGKSEAFQSIVTSDPDGGARQIFLPPNERPTGYSHLYSCAKHLPPLTKNWIDPSKKEEETLIYESTTFSKNNVLPEERTIKRRKVSEELPSGDQRERNQRIISPSSSSDEVPTGKFNDDSRVASAPVGKTLKMEASTEHALDSAHLAALPHHVNYGNPMANPYLMQYFNPLSQYVPMPLSRRGPHHHGISQPPVRRYMQSLQGQLPVVAYPPPSYQAFYGLHHPSPYQEPYHSDTAEAGRSQLPQYTAAEEPLSSTDVNVKQYPSMVGPQIKSITELQEEAITTGRGKNANRCIPLKAPISSRSLCGIDKTKKVDPIPDFFQLVNFPDHVKKVRSASGSFPTDNVKRMCVMCGKQRLCSSSATHLGGSNRGKENKDVNNKKRNNSKNNGNESNIIIPTQNKGLCTACDVKVWVFLGTGVEIKWCKGCKNFRAWAAFGDKGLATKCLRCRHRQREKYALQKKTRQQKPTEQQQRQHDIDAAKGLRDLMTASNHA